MMMTETGLRFGRVAAWCPEGFRMEITPAGELRIEALNPERLIGFYFTRWELVKLALWMLRKSVRVKL